MPGPAEEDLVLWGTLSGWSEKLGVLEDILKERFEGLHCVPCRIVNPHDPTQEIDTMAYSEPHVRSACADLFKD